MNLTYVLTDEKGNAGQTLDVHQGEIKTVSLYWFKNGVPYKYPAASAVELIAKIYAGVGNPVVQKKLSLSEVTLITLSTGEVIGFSCGLTAANTAALPVSSTVGMSVIVENATSSPTVVDELDVPNAFNVSAPLVP